MAGKRPKFFSEIIFQTNPDIDREATIPFDILEGSLKKLIHKFTTILFTKLNYSGFLHHLLLFLHTKLKTVYNSALILPDYIFIYLIITNLLTIPNLLRILN